MHRRFQTACFFAVGLAVSVVGLRAQQPPDDPRRLDIQAIIEQAKGKSHDGPGGPEKKFGDFSEVTKGAEKIDGLYTLYRKDDILYAEIKPNQFEQPFLVPITIAKGLAMAGNPLNFGDEPVMFFKRVGDKIQLIRRNIHFKASSGTPLEKAVKQNYTDSILMGLSIVAMNPQGGGVLINLNDVFFSDFGELGLGMLDRNRTSWNKVKGFPNNLELEVEATFGRSGSGGGDAVADGRGLTIVIHYSIVKLPDPGYRPRAADERVGYFLSAIKDFSSTNPDTQFIRQVNRWRLEKSDSKAKVSAPKKQIVWWIEDTVPFEYRPFVEEGILEWNKAFEKAGFRNAIAVRWQQDALRDEFDPEDINYCTFRWITTPSTYAMSCLRANPLTGEMIDGDVIFDASWIRHWKNDYAVITGHLPTSSATDPARTSTAAEPLAYAEIISPIMAIEQGFGQPFPSPESREARLRNPNAEVPDLLPAEWQGDPAQVQLRRRIFAGQQYSGCQFALGMRPELGMAALALAARADDAAKDDAAKIERCEKCKDKPEPCDECKAKAALAKAGRCEKCKDKPEPCDDCRAKAKKAQEDAAKLPDELIGQMIKEVVMHEVGHSLGLRHNFHGSTMLNNDQLNDVELTRKKGMVGSVMDYNPMNIAPKGSKQGDFTTTTIGPYDYWAIEYAYKPIDGDEERELKKIAARSPEPDLAYGTDDDMSNNDPFVHVYDLGSDPIRYGLDRIKLASELMKDLDKQVVRDDESWARLRQAFSILLNQWGNAAYLTAAHIGGQSVNYDHKAEKGARDPVTPVKGAKQREALKVLQEEILSDKAFKFSPGLLRKLTSERWYHWGSEGRNSDVGYPINEQVLGIQKIVLSRCLAAGTLSRLQDHEAMTDEGGEPLRMAELFRALTDGIWSECPAPDKDAPNQVALSTVRRNLQRAYLQRLSGLVIGQRSSSIDDLYGYVVILGGSGGSVPPDAKSLARMHLKEIDGRLERVLNRKETQIDDTTRAHLDECRQRIAKVLQANLNANEP